MARPLLDRCGMRLDRLTAAKGVYQRQDQDKAASQGGHDPQD
jgi:hypothetical protein